MAVPEVAFDGNEVADEVVIPLNPVPEEVFSEDDDRDVPCICPGDYYVVMALELVAM